MLLLGSLRGGPWRAETTLLPGTSTVGRSGQDVQTPPSQFVAYVDDRIFEVPVDRLAQADDRSVWYFGQGALTYEDGLIEIEGTWLAASIERWGEP